MDRNTYHARCGAGVACGGHAWSRDGLAWSNQSIGAFGPVVRFKNGTFSAQADFVIIWRFPFIIIF